MTVERLERVVELAAIERATWRRPGPFQRRAHALLEAQVAVQQAGDGQRWQRPEQPDDDASKQAPDRQSQPDKAQRAALE